MDKNFLVLVKTIALGIQNSHWRGCQEKKDEYPKKQFAIKNSHNFFCHSDQSEAKWRNLRALAVACFLLGHVDPSTSLGMTVLLQSNTKPASPLWQPKNTDNVGALRLYIRKNDIFQMVISMLKLDVNIFEDS